MGAELIPNGVLYAQSLHPLTTEDVRSLMEETIHDLSLAEGDEDLVDDAKKLAREQCGHLLQGVSSLTSMHSWLRYTTGRVNRERLKYEYPTFAQYIDGYCLMVRARLALLLYPEKINELAEMMKINGISLFRPQIFRDVKNESAKMWFANNVRDQSGEIDWPLVHEQLNEVYPCEFEYRPTRPPFTLETALVTLRELADRFVIEKGHWHPAMDIEMADKGVYNFITSLDCFRRPAERPDIEYRKDSRPNWFAIAEAMGPEYQKTMVVGFKGEEQQYRSFDDAMAELQDLIRETMNDGWAMHQVSTLNSALYGWIRIHCRNADGLGIDIQRVLAALPPELQKKYRGQAYRDTTFFQKRRELRM